MPLARIRVTMKDEMPVLTGIVASIGKNCSYTLARAQPTKSQRTYDEAVV